MKKYFFNEFTLFLYLFIFIISLTIIQSLKQDYTSIIDFDLTVIHNSLQLISNQFPDFQDLTAYSHFLTYGIFYKIFSFFDHSLVTNIEILSRQENPELSLKKLYFISRIANSIIHFITIIFFYRILGLFKIDKFFKILTIFFLIISETFLANIIILRTDIIAYCYFIIAAYYLLDFVKSEKKSNLFLISFFMVFSLLAKVQIIFLFMFIYFFFVIYAVNEKKGFNPKKFGSYFFELINKNIKYLLLSVITIYFLFQIFLNNFVNTSTGVGYFDFLCFAIYFLILYTSISLVCKTKNFSKRYFYNTFFYLILLSLLWVIILKFLDIIGIIKINFNIIFSLTNPFYFLKIYSPLNSDLSLNLIFEIFNLFFKNFNFNLIYTCLLLSLFAVSVSNIYHKIKDKFILNNNIYIILFLVMTLFLVAINNFRYNVSYNIYAIPFLFLSLALFVKSIKKKLFFSSIISLLVFYNFWVNVENYKMYVFKPSNLTLVCEEKSIRDFYYHWARNFDESFFFKICKNNNLSFK